MKVILLPKSIVKPWISIGGFLFAECTVDMHVYISKKNTSLQRNQDHFERSCVELNNWYCNNHCNKYCTNWKIQ